MKNLFIEFPALKLVSMSINLKVICENVINQSIYEMVLGQWR